MPLTRPQRDALLRIARRHARRLDDAEDLVQTALLAATERAKDLSDPSTVPWLKGVVRRRAAFEARSAARRRHRESETARPVPADAPDGASDLHGTLKALPARLRVVVQLAVGGLTRSEIKHVLDLSDTALRKRISDLRSALLCRGGPPNVYLKGDLAFGAIRKSLLGAVRWPDTILASHDPDGHLFLLCRSQSAPRRQQANDNQEGRVACSTKRD